MNDLIVRPVKIMLDRERNLIMDLNAFEILEDIYENEPPIYKVDAEGNQTEITDLLGKAFEYLSKNNHRTKHIKNFLFAGLAYEDESLTVKKLGAMISYPRLLEITDKIWRAIAQGTPEPGEESDSQGE